MEKILKPEIDLTDSGKRLEMREGITGMVLYMVGYTIVMLYPFHQYLTHRTDMSYFLTSHFSGIFTVLVMMFSILSVIVMMHPVVHAMKKTSRALFLFYLIIMALLGIWFFTIIQITTPEVIF